MNFRKSEIHFFPCVFVHYFLNMLAAKVITFLYIFFHTALLARKLNAQFLALSVFFGITVSITSKAYVFHGL